MKRTTGKQRVVAGAPGVYCNVSSTLLDSGGAPASNPTSSDQIGQRGYASMIRGRRRGEWCGWFEWRRPVYIGSTRSGEWSRGGR